MQIGRVEGCTRVLGKSQGYMGLPIRDELTNCTVNGEGTPAMVTAWMPLPKELAALNAGAPVHVRLLGVKHPPIMVEVGTPPDGEAERTPGPLGTFSHGQLDPTDEGDVQIAVAFDPEKSIVRVEFGAPVAWLGLPKEHAVQFARLLLKNAGATKVEITF